MNLPLGDTAAEFMELRFEAGTWEQRGVPEAGCRLRTEAMERIIANGGAYQIEQLIYGLMDWLDVTADPEPALEILRLMLDRHYPDDGRSHPPPLEFPLRPPERSDWSEVDQSPEC